MTELPLHGRVALVTGAGRNLGRSIAMTLASAGAGVVVNARSNADEAQQVAAEVQAFGVPALAVTADVVDPVAIAAMFEAVVERFGHGPDILVNNAAVRRRESLVDITDESWREIMGSTIDGAFHCARLAVPHMVEQRWGRIVNIIGQAAFKGHDHMAHVVAAKAGLHGLTKALALELGPHGVTVNSVSPGLIRGDDPKVGPSEEALRARAAEVPVRSIPQARDVATTCLYVVTEPGFVTGQVIHVNGGEYF